MTVLQQKGVELAHCHHPWTCGYRLSGQQDMSHSQSHPLGVEVVALGVPSLSAFPFTPLTHGLPWTRWVGKTEQPCPPKTDLFPLKSHRGLATNTSMEEQS